MIDLGSSLIVHKAVNKDTNTTHVSWLGLGFNLFVNSWPTLHIASGIFRIYVHVQIYSKGESLPFYN